MLLEYNPVVSYKQISLEQLFAFLEKVDSTFPIPISRKVDLHTYCEKLYAKAHMECIVNDDMIESLVAGYITNTINNMAYIALVGTLPEAKGRGYATQLLSRFIASAKEANLSGVHLYTAYTNHAAIHLYQKLGFVPYHMKDELRPDDRHFVYWIKKEQL